MIISRARGTFYCADLKSYWSLGKLDNLRCGDVHQGLCWNLKDGSDCDFVIESSLIAMSTALDGGEIVVRL